MNNLMMETLYFMAICYSRKLANEPGCIIVAKNKELMEPFINSWTCYSV